ncbi:MAG: NYN domain-containing protein [Anaerolineales bacterium]|jgi:hypothetical protein|nr:NYN domain-containing protein [Anaerolineales bacterium]
MQIIIDGHNLIPNIPGLSLSDLDDEQRLIEMVQEYCRVRRHQAEIYFDNAPPGMAGLKSMGSIKVKFAQKGRTADQDIKDRVAKLGKAARNILVVTSDQSIQIAVRAGRTQVMSSSDFARELQQALAQVRGGASTTEEFSLSDQEIVEWMKLFKKGKPD